MIQAEQLFLTRIRVAKETSLGNGTASGNWIVPPMTAAAVGRNAIQIAQSSDVFRQLKRRKIVSQDWTFRTSHEVGLPFLRWILEATLTPQGDGSYALNPESEGESFVIETTSQNGDIALYSGARLTEIQIVLEDRRINRLELTWSALQRATLESEAAGATDENAMEGKLIPNRLNTVAAKVGEWAADPREDDQVVCHGGQIVLMREIQPTNYGADGIPVDHTKEPWKVLAEIFTPEIEGLTDVAFADTWNGRISIWMGEGDDRLTMESATGFVGEEDLKAFDWRVRRIAVEAQTDTNRALMKFQP